MSYQRIDRISEEVRREVDAIIREELHDPRIGGTYTVTRAEVTGDLRYAKIHISVLEDDDFFVLEDDRSFHTRTCTQYYCLCVCAYEAEQAKGYESYFSHIGCKDTKKN